MRRRRWRGAAVVDKLRNKHALNRRAGAERVGRVARDVSSRGHHAGMVKTSPK